MPTAAREASAAASATSPGLKAGLAGSRPNAAHPTTTPRAIRGTASSEVQPAVISLAGWLVNTGCPVAIARQRIVSAARTTTSPMGRARPGGEPRRQA